MIKSYDKIKPSLYISSILIALSLLSSAVLSSSSSSADVVDDVVVTVPISCNMSSELDEAHTATINPGQYQSDIGTTNFTVFCNDNSGYAIYAIGYSNEEYGNTKMLATINNELSPTNDINTGTATSGNTSSWSMKLVPVTTASSGTTQPYTPTIESDTSGSFANYHVIPEEYTKVATFTSNTDFTIGSSLQSTYQVYIDGTKPAGTYVGKVKYTLVHPNDAAKPEIPESPSTSCTTPVPNYTYMQDINSTNISSVLSSLEENSPYYLRDKRDNQPYCVAKLKDGKLWMTENLNIAGGTALSSEDTDFESTYTLPTTNGWTVADGKLVLPPSAIKNDANNDLTDSTQFDTNNYAYVFNSGMKENCGANGQYTPCYSYYSWDAATLASGRSIATENTDADYSICPKNWRLPTSGSNSNEDWKRGDFYTLATNYDVNLESNYSTYSHAFFNNAGPDTTPDFLLAHNYAHGSFNNLDNSGGYYWSSTSGSNTAVARLLFFSYEKVISAQSYIRGLGFSVRCLFGS